MNMAENVYFSVDRIEGETAILMDDHGRTVPIPMTAFTDAVSPGDMVCQREGVFLLDEAETQRRRSYVSTLQSKLRNRMK